MYFVDELYFHEDGSFGVGFIYMDGNMVSPDSEHVKGIMQYTGLKDKNGKEIYEGDIIAWDYEYDSDYDGDMPIVKRSTGKAEVKDIFDRWRIHEAATEGNGVEVIGNIYEKPELI